jgi:IS30 family transposase
LYTRLHKLPNKNNPSDSQSIRRILNKETNALYALTFENDKTFAKHRAIGLALGLETYFTKPHTSQDKGAVEDRISQIRRFFYKRPTFVKYPIIVSDKFKNFITTDL